MCYSHMHTLLCAIKLFALHSLTLLSLCSVFKARQYIFTGDVIQRLCIAYMYMLSCR